MFYQVRINHFFCHAKNLFPIMIVGAYLFISILLSPTVSAEVYKTVDADGNIRYSDQRPKSTTNKNTPAQTSTVETSTDTNITDSKDKISSTHPSWLKDAQKKRAKKEANKIKGKQQQIPFTQWKKNYTAAKTALKEANKKLKAGVIAGEGDFVGRAGGGARPTEQYFAKQQTLEHAVTKAKKELKRLKQAKPH